MSIEKPTGTCGFWLYFGDLVAQTHLIYVVEWYYHSEILEVPPNYAVQAVEIYIRWCFESKYL
jgi:hypothetical protein